MNRNIEKGQVMNGLGVVYDVQDIKPEQIDLERIAIGLSRIPRFLGQGSRDYSVGQHCLAMARYAEDHDYSRDMILWAALHEAFEAFTGVDLPSPIKMMCPAYKEAEIAALAVVADKFSIMQPADDIKWLDQCFMVAEALDFMPRPEYWLTMMPEGALPDEFANYLIEDSMANETVAAELLSLIKKYI